MMKRKFFTTQDMILASIFTALIAIGAFIRIPIPVVPFTLQVTFVILAGLLLGGKWGAMSAFTYMLLGLVGLPIFTQGGGLSYVLQPTFGYIIGFCFGAYVTGTIANKVPRPSYKRLLTASFAGLGIVYLIGMIYFFAISNFVLGTGIEIWPLFLYCFLVFVPGDGTLCVLSAILAKRIIPVINRRR
ncbi:MAG: biotin transporter BioY [Anaerovoracaceae bacterium]